MKENIDNGLQRQNWIFFDICFILLADFSNTRKHIHLPTTSKGILPWCMASVVYCSFNSFSEVFNLNFSSSRLVLSQSSSSADPKINNTRPWTKIIKILQWSVFINLKSVTILSHIKYDEPSGIMKITLLNKQHILVSSFSLVKAQSTITQ